MGLTNHRAAKVPMLTVRHMKTRRQYVKDMILYNWAQVRRWPMRTIPPHPLPQVRFSDEKRFCVWNDGPVRVWRREGERFRQGRTKGCVKHSKSIMMHLIIASDNQSRLTLCDTPQNSQSYQTTVLTPNLPFLRHRTSAARRATPIVYMQDGASCHTSLSTTRFLRTRGVVLLPSWPPNSPDLNPVEHCWAWISRQLVGMQFGTARELEGDIRTAWDSRPPPPSSQPSMAAWCAV